MEVRDQILRQATRLMAARGYEGTSLSAVADAVGVKKPSVLYHFPSKAELRRAVLDQLLSRWNDVLPRLLMASARTGLDKFDAVVGELLDFFAQDADRARLLVRELLDRPEDMQDTLQRQVRPWVDVVASYIRKGQETGQIRADVDPEAYTIQVAVTALAGIATSAAGGVVLGDDERRSPLDRGRAELVRLLRASLFTPGYLEHQSMKESPVLRGAE